MARKRDAATVDSSTKPDDKPEKKPKEKPKAKEGEVSEYQKFLKSYNMLPPEEFVRLDGQTRVISTGIPVLDVMTGLVDPITGLGGFKQGSSVEFLGFNSCYKTGTVEHMIREVQRLYPPKWSEKHKAMIPSVLCIFSEPPQYQRMKDFGIKLDSDHIMIHAKHPGTTAKDLVAEEALQFACDAAEEFENLVLIVIDSVSALIPLAALEKDGKEKQIGDTVGVATKAKTFNPYIEKWSKLKTNAILAMISQYRNPISAGPMTPKDSPLRPSTAAGTSKDFYADVRISCYSSIPQGTKKRKILPGLEEKVADGFEIKYRQVKNKYGNTSNYRTIKTTVNFQWYTDPETGERLKGYINHNEDILMMYDKLQDWIRQDPEKDRFPTLNQELLSTLKRKGGSNWGIGEDNYRSRGDAAEALKKLPELRMEILRGVVKYGGKLWEAETQVKSEVFVEDEASYRIGSETNDDAEAPEEGAEERECID